jgi:virginiamycin B lyase
MRRTCIALFWNCLSQRLSSTSTHNEAERGDVSRIMNRPRWSRFVVLTVLIFLAALIVFNRGYESDVTRRSEFQASESVSVVERSKTNVIPRTYECNVETVEVLPDSRITDPQCASPNPSPLSSLPFAIKRASAIPSNQLSVTYTHWHTFTSNHDVAVDSSNNVYFTERLEEKIGRLDPTTNTITEWPIITEGTEPHCVTVDSSDRVYFTERRLDLQRIGRLDPTTNVITEWALTSLFFPADIAVDSLDNVYFTDTNLERIGKLDPTTNTITEWSVPGGDYPRGIAVDSLDNVYFADQYANLIGKLDPTTNTITEWPIPTADAGPVDVAIDRSNNVFFSCLHSDVIGKLDPSTDVISEWTMPMEDFRPYGITIDSAENIYFAELNGVFIGRLVPSTGVFTEWRVATGGGIHFLAVDAYDNLYCSGYGIGRLS